MTPLQRLQLRQSEVRERLNALLNGHKDRTDKETSELRTLTTEAQSLEVEIRAALVAEPEPEERPVADPSATQLEELRQSFECGAVLRAMHLGGKLEGATREYQEERSLAVNQIPIEVFESPVETRAVTPAPSTADRSLRPIVPAIFDRSIAGFLGVAMPNAPVGDFAVPMVTTDVKAGPKAKGAAADEAAGAISVITAQPRRVTGSFRVQVEDLARLRGFEAAFRRNLQDVLADGVDDLILNGSASGDGTVHGLLAQLGDPAATYPGSGAPSYGSYLAAMSSLIDGKHSVDESGVSMLVGLETYRIMAGLVATDRDRSASAAIRADWGGLRASGRLAAPNNKVQAAIGVRRPMGVPNAVMPTWGALTIDDMVTGAAKGERVITSYVLVGDVMIERSAGYEQLGLRTAA